MTNDVHAQGAGGSMAAEKNEAPAGSAARGFKGVAQLVSPDSDSDRAEELEPWLTLELYGQQLLICTGSGCRSARAIDLHEVVSLLPALLERQERETQQAHWRQLVDVQRRQARKVRE